MLNTEHNRKMQIIKWMRMKMAAQIEATNAPNLQVP